MRLRTARSTVDQALATQIEKGDALLAREIRTSDQLDEVRSDRTSWDEFNEALLRKHFEDEKVVEDYKGSLGIGFFTLGGGPPPLHEQVDELHDSVRTKLRRLRSLRDQLELYESDEAERAAEPVLAVSTVPGDGIFIVHGHETGLRESVARYIVTITGRSPLILQETATLGSETVIEKLERVAGDAGFAVVLLTGDDVGCVRADTPDGLRSRARQNVVLELGYFFGRLGRGRVVALYETGVELPSDAGGIVYVSADGDGWKVDLARVLKAAGIDVDLNKAI